jgi:hypothetical protein
MIIVDTKEISVDVLECATIIARAKLQSTNAGEHQEPVMSCANAKTKMVMLANLG